MHEQEVYEQLSSFISENKRALFEQNAVQRTRHITVVLENIFQPHNASAVLRTCDLMGIQDVHVIEDRNTYSPNPEVALGAQKWLNIHHYQHGSESTLACINELRNRGYRVAATTLADDTIPLSEVPIDEPLAICFGTEMTGLSATLVDQADIKVRIPMHGFTESYNISVSAAIMLYDLTQRLRNSAVEWRLSPEELIDLKIAWTRKVLRKAEEVEQRIREGS